MPRNLGFLETFPVLAALPTSSGSGRIVTLSTDGHPYFDHTSGWRLLDAQPPANPSDMMLKSVYDTNNDGKIDTAALATGTPSAAAFLNGLGAWAAPSGLPNLALLRSYTVTPAPSAPYPDSGGELTNGVRAIGNYGDPAYTGWDSNPAQVVVTIDLGQNLSVGRVEGYFYSLRAAGIYTPVSANVDVSVDGSTYTPWIVGSIPDQVADSSEIVWAVTPSAGTSGRYVRFTLVGSASHQYIFLSELGVYGRQIADNDPRLLGNLAPVKTVTASYTALTTDGVLLANAATAALTVTLPTAAARGGQTYTVKKIDASVNAVTLATTSTQTIDGALTFVLKGQNYAVTVISDGANWAVQSAPAPAALGTGTPTATTLLNGLGVWADPNPLPLAGYLEKQRVGGARGLVFTGTSLTYGQDATATGTGPAINGAVQTRTPESYPQALVNVLSFLANTTVTLYERGFPGDRTTEMLTRWASDNVAADVEIIECDHNDANNYGSQAGGGLSIAQHTLNLEALAARAISRGRSPVFVLAPIPQDYPSAQHIRTMQNATAALAASMGVPCFWVDELLRVLPNRLIWNDGVHLTPVAYTAWGAVMSMMFGPCGATPPKVGPGDTLTALSGAHTGGTVTARAGAPDGQTVALTTSQLMVVPFACNVGLIPVITAFNPTAAAATLGLYYYGNRAGTGTYSVNVPAGATVSVADRGHPAGALRGVILRLDSGTALHVDRVTFQATGTAINTPVRTVTGSYTVGPGDSVIFANAASGPLTIMLPNPSAAVSSAQATDSSASAPAYRIKKVDTSTNAVTITTAGGLIDGAATAVLTTPYNSFDFIPDGTNYGGF